MKKPVKYKTAICAIFSLFFCVAVAMAQTASIPSHNERYDWQSETYAGAAGADADVVLVETHTVTASRAAWLRLNFGDASLGAGSYLTITSLQDGAMQRLDARSLAQWRNTSAYFNGNAVEVRLYAAANAQNIFVRIDEVTVGDWVSGAPSPLSQCGGNDDRTVSSHKAVGRLINNGTVCTSWINFNAMNVTAGHCFADSSGVVQFNVPLSNPDGTINHPGPQDQYTVDKSLLGFTQNGIGDDWSLFMVFDNSNTGAQPITTQLAWFIASQTFTPGTYQAIGYGADADNLTLSNTQQSHTGPDAGSSGSLLQYQIDTEAGSDGSPIIDTATGNVVGVHTHGGCTTGGGFNSGTSFLEPTFWARIRGILFQDFVTLTPTTLPIIIPSGGGSFTYNFRWHFYEAASRQIEIWDEVDLPDGSTIMPVSGPPTIVTPVPLQVITATVTITVPAGAPAGNYEYRVLVGEMGIDEDGQDNLAITKSGTVVTISKPGVNGFTGRFEFTQESLESIDPQDPDQQEIKIQTQFVPDNFYVEQNYPNPFNPSTVIRYGLDKESRVSVKIFNLLGEEVATLVNEHQSAGFKSVVWNGANHAGQVVPAGVYIYRVEADGVVQTKKMILAK